MQHVNSRRQYIRITDNIMHKSGYARESIARNKAGVAVGRHGRVAENESPQLNQLCIVDEFELRHMCAHEGHCTCRSPMFVFIATVIGDAVSTLPSARMNQNAGEYHALELMS